MNTDSKIDQDSYWVVVADEAQAIIYAQETRRAPLREVLTLQNEEAQKRKSELISDRDGRSYDSHGQGRHAMTNEKMDSKKHAATIFAKDVSARIVQALHDGRCRAYSLIAAPRFLGLLRDELSTAAIDKPYLTIDKNIVGQDTAVIQKLLDIDAHR